MILKWKSLLCSSTVCGALFFFLFFVFCFAGLTFRPVVTWRRKGFIWLILPGHVHHWGKSWQKLKQELENESELLLDSVLITEQHKLQQVALRKWTRVTAELMGLIDPPVCIVLSSSSSFPWWTPVRGLLWSSLALVYSCAVCAPTDNFASFWGLSLSIWADRGRRGKH